MSYSGSCQCGAVKFQINSELTDIVYCHCSMCRKMSGSAFLAFGSVEHEKLQLQGLSSISTYSANTGATRSFCSKCGSTLFWQQNGIYGLKYKCIAIGSLDTNFTPNEWQHYYTSCKATWFSINDGKRQYRETS